jgi:hypothetical protein
LAPASGLLLASRIAGSRLAYGSKATCLPDLLVCQPGLRDRVLDELRTLAA